MKLNSQELAMNFLCKRKPYEWDMPQSDYVFLLMDFEDKKGSEAIEGLAGFYLFAIRKYTGEKQSLAILETFNHDIGERNDPVSLPRSTDFRNTWIEEFTNHIQ